MNPNINYAAVGLFLIVGVVSFVGLVIWLGKAGDTVPQKNYVVRIDGAVTGLANGSAVRYLGVNVGSVTDIALDTDGEPAVEVFIQVNENVPVGSSTYATLVAQGVTGVSNIDLANDPTLDSSPGKHPSGVRVIPFRPSGLNALLYGSGDVAQEARRLLARLNEWAAAGNRARVEEILVNLQLVSASLAEQRRNIPELVSMLSETLASLQHAAAGLDRAVAEDWPAMAGNLKETTGNLAEASSRIDMWLARNEPSVDRLLGEGFDDVADLVANLREVSENLTRLSNRLREDPSRLIYRPQQDPVEVEP